MRNTGGIIFFRSEYWRPFGAYECAEGNILWSNENNFEVAGASISKDDRARNTLCSLLLCPSLVVLGQDDNCVLFARRGFGLRERARVLSLWTRGFIVESNERVLFIACSCFCCGVERESEAEALPKKNTKKRRRGSHPYDGHSRIECDVRREGGCP